ncbi:dihydrodipicolinate synthase family protein [Catenovulum adriaticum]|uniref:Dihydrodipicolinate synthase family protein n=1 Tax=Catenovulum adriaticum TaxID=2984846 RepID=A0ABY7ARD6_9ALTE|nr:dihydrodipicolinate synthase family protein [Catenovulum sp. TS8]WAJ71050.1 dihydrodipicolinate synthase family protein [Catenovulum sp. TS8]
MFSEIKQKMSGPWYTIFTPFDKDENIDFEALEKYLTFLYQRGARRFYAMAYNSRYSQLTHAEILSLNEFCIKTLKKLDKDNIVIVGDPIHCSTKESLEFTLHAKEHGADLISLIFREKHFTDDQVLEHFDYIGQKSDFPLLVHEMPFLSGFDGVQMHWPVSLLENLPKVPHIAALKEDAKDFDITCKALSLEPNIKVIIAGGGKAAFRNYRPHGADAWLNGISIIDAKIAEVFWKACINGDVATQDFIINELEQPFFSGVVKKYGWHRTNKALLQAAILMHRRDRMPLKHLSDTEFLEVQNIYNEIEYKWKTWESKKG